MPPRVLGLRCGLEGMRVVAPPIRPKLPNQVVDGERCHYCGLKGYQCRRERYGNFCVGVTYRYWKFNKETYTEIEAKRVFTEAYANASEYRFHLQSSRKSIRAEPLKQLPACLEYSDLVFALNLIEWERMVEFTEGILVESTGDKNNQENNEQE